MKEATVLVSLTKDHQVYKMGVTPPEVLLLVAEHQKGAGGCPVAVEKATIVDVKRTLDDELDRLKTKYPQGKVKQLMNDVRDIPVDDFDKAIERGLKLQLLSGALITTKLI
jgi:hypothetical protein